MLPAASALRVRRPVSVLSTEGWCRARHWLVLRAGNGYKHRMHCGVEVTESITNKQHIIIVQAKRMHTGVPVVHA